MKNGRRKQLLYSEETIEELDTHRGDELRMPGLHNIA